MNGFFLKQGQGLKTLAAHPSPNLPLNAPPRTPNILIINQTTIIVPSTYSLFPTPGILVIISVEGKLNTVNLLAVRNLVVSKSL